MDKKNDLCGELNTFFEDVKKKIKEENIFDFDGRMCKRYDLNGDLNELENE